MLEIFLSVTNACLSHVDFTVLPIADQIRSINGAILTLLSL